MDWMYKVALKLLRMPFNLKTFIQTFKPRLFPNNFTAYINRETIDNKKKYILYDRLSCKYFLINRKSSTLAIYVLLILQSYGTCAWVKKKKKV